MIMNLHDYEFQIYMDYFVIIVDLCLLWISNCTGCARVDLEYLVFRWIWYRVDSIRVQCQF